MRNEFPGGLILGNGSSQDTFLGIPIFSRNQSPTGFLHIPWTYLHVVQAPETETQLGPCPNHPCLRYLRVRVQGVK